MSPDGTGLAKMGVAGLQPAFWVRTLRQADDRAHPIPARHFRWTAANRYLAAIVAPNGDEIARSQALAVDREDAAGWTLAPAPRCRGHQPGKVSSSIPDRRGKLRARVAEEGGQATLQRPEAEAPGGWGDATQGSRFDLARLLKLNHGAEDLGDTRLRARQSSLGAPASDRRGRDRGACHGRLGPRPCLINRSARQPLVADAMPGYPCREVFDAALRERLDTLAGGEPAEVSITSMDVSEGSMTPVNATERGRRRCLLPAEGPAQLLGESGPSLLRGQLARRHPTTLATRDGLQLHGYLTLPEGVQSRQLAPILLVHDCPWSCSSVPK